MNDITFEDSGMEEFQDMLGSYLSKVDEKSALDAIEEGAKEFVNDLLRPCRSQEERSQLQDIHIWLTHLAISVIRQE